MSEVIPPNERYARFLRSATFRELMEFIDELCRKEAIVNNADQLTDEELTEEVRRRNRKVANWRELASRIRAKVVNTANNTKRKRVAV